MASAGGLRDAGYAGSGGNVVRPARGKSEVRSKRGGQLTRESPQTPQTGGAEQLDLDLWTDGESLSITDLARLHRDLTRAPRGSCLASQVGGPCAAPGVTSPRGTMAASVTTTPRRNG